MNALKDYPRNSIKAQNSELRLYESAELKNRTRKKMLNIKPPNLKKRVRENLVEGVEGIYVLI